MELLSDDNSSVQISTQLLYFNQTLNDCLHDAIADEQPSFPTPFPKQTIVDVIAFSQAISDGTHDDFQFRDPHHAIALLDAAQFFNNQLLEHASTRYLVEQWRFIAQNDVPDHLKHYLLFHVPGAHAVAFIQHFYPPECHRQLQRDYIQRRYKLDDLAIAENGEVFENKTVRKLVQIDTDNHTRPDVINVLQHLCGNGHLRSLQWLIDRFHLIVDDARSDDNLALRWAASNGHLHVIQWLVDHFHLTVDDAKSNNNEAFRWAARNRYLHVLQWLTDHFHLTADDAKSNNDEAFRWAAGNGHLHVLQWLTNHFHLTTDDARSACAFRWAAGYRHAHVTQWLGERFGIHE